MNKYVVLGAILAGLLVGIVVGLAIAPLAPKGQAFGSGAEEALLQALEELKPVAENVRPNPEVPWLHSAKPRIAATAFVDPRATVIGDVRIGEHVYVAPGAVLRADEGAPIIIGDDSNVQDGVIIHALKGTKVVIGKRVSLAHGCIVHGPAEIGDDTFIGFRAIVFKAKIGSKCFIGPGAVIIGVEIPDGKYVPPGMVVTSQEQVDKLPSATESHWKLNEEVVEVNKEFAKAYAELMGHAAEHAG